MSNYYFHVVILEGCGYSDAAKELLDKHNNIKKDYTFVEYINKEKYKKPNENITTYPQVFLKKNNMKGSLHIGGFDNLNDLFTSFYHKKYDDKKINEVYKKLNIPKRTLLRIIELINS